VRLIRSGATRKFVPPFLVVLFLVLLFRANVFCSAKFRNEISASRCVGISERGTRALFRSFLSDSWSGRSSEIYSWNGTICGTEPMTPHDQELLHKQLHGIDNRPAEGVLMLAVAAVFFAGMALGGFLFAYTDQPPLRVAANDIAASTSAPIVPTTR
jgi:hypothetical protein